jgi:F-type H+-transporting ATPase subunit a
MRIRNAVLVALAIGAVMYFVLGLVFPREDLHISVKAEALMCIGGALDAAHPGECASGFPITNSLVTTVIVDLLLVLTIVFGVRNAQMVPRGFQNFVELVVGTFYDFAVGVDKKNVAKFFPFAATAFLLIILSNLLGLVPGAGSIGMCQPYAKAAAEGGEAGHQAASYYAERGWPLTCEAGELLVPYLRAPSADLNMTLALGLISVVLIQYFGLKALGWEYLTRFFNFREGPMFTVIGFIELISEFIRIISFAFRLFGNIFAGEVVLVVLAHLFPYMLPLPFYAFEVFVAAMQAVIFSVLTLVFMSMATQAHGGHDDAEHGAAAH